MNQQFISAKVYRDYASMISKLNLELPSAISILEDGKIKEFPVFHRMILEDYHNADSTNYQFQPKLNIVSFIIRPYDENTFDETCATLINPETAWQYQHQYWAADPVKIFKEYLLANDKKYGKLAWCNNHDRELNYPEFVINEEQPIAQISILLSVLQMANDAINNSKVPTIFVGTVDENGVVTPSKEFESKETIAPVNTVPTITFPPGHRTV